jgi:hypothetical protein
VLLGNIGHGAVSAVIVVCFFPMVPPGRWNTCDQGGAAIWHGVLWVGVMGMEGMLLLMVITGANVAPHGHQSCKWNDILEDV